MTCNQAAEIRINKLQKDMKDYIELKLDQDTSIHLPKDLKGEATLAQNTDRGEVDISFPVEKLVEFFSNLQLLQNNETGS